MKITKIHLAKKPEYIKLGQDTDFYCLFTKIEREFDYCFLLESLGKESYTSRYSIIGFAPANIIKARGERLFMDDKLLDCPNPYYGLKEIIPAGAIAKRYAGGLIGFMGYDCTNYFEPLLGIKPHPLFDRFQFGFFTDGLIFDKETAELFYFHYGSSRLDLVKRIMKKRYKEAKFKAKLLGDTMSKRKHQEKVELIKEEIIAGNSFQCQLGFKREYEISGDTLAIYSKLRQVNPSPYMYFLKMGGQKIIGASPELLFQLKQGQMETFPLAGTIGRGKNEEEDRILARQLLNDPKEIAEHNMLVDMHRNDLGRVAEFGTVKVRSLMDIKRFAHLQHISSEITGIMKRGEDMFSALSHNFPAGTLTGAPKFESMKIIERVEDSPRGPYGGAIGHFGVNGDCTFTIPIRTLFISGNYGFTQASSGIVYDSIAEKEYEEVQRKLRSITEVLKC